MVIEMAPTGPSLLEKRFALLVRMTCKWGELLSIRKLLPRKTVVSTIIFFIVLILSVRIQNGILAFLILSENSFNDGFTILRN